MYFTSAPHFPLYPNVNLPRASPIPLRVDAKGLLCYWAARELKMPLTDLARQRDMIVSGVGYAVQRRKSIALCYNYRLFE